MIGGIAGIHVEPEIDDGDFMALRYQNAQPVREPLFVEGGQLQIVRCAQCGNSARWVRCGGDWKRVYGRATEALPEETGRNG